MALAAIAICVSLLLYGRSKDALANVTTKAEVIESHVTGTQAKLVEGVLAIASPPQVPLADQALAAALPKMFENPQMFQLLIEQAQKEQK